MKYIEHLEHKLIKITVEGKVTEAEFDAFAGKMERFIEQHGTVKYLETREAAACAARGALAQSHQRPALQLGAKGDCLQKGGGLAMCF